MSQCIRMVRETDLLGDVVNGVGNVVHVARSNTSHGLGLDLACWPVTGSNFDTPLPRSALSSAGAGC